MLLSPSGSDQPFWQSTALTLTDSSHVSEIRRLAVSVALDLGFNELVCGKVALLVTETATNILKHARDGQMFLRTLKQGGVNGLEVLALDRGPGMQNLDRCLRDGYSTAGSPGTGLGAIVRLSDSFEVQTLPAVGTAILVRVWAHSLAKTSSNTSTEPSLGVGAIDLPKVEEEVSGDSWAIDQRDSRAILVVADGLGHGPIAAEASRAAIRVFRKNNYVSPEALMSDIHAALKSTRGAAVAVAELDVLGEKIRFVGVGNISGTIFADGGSRSMVSHNGTAGHIAHKIQGFDYPFPRHSTFIMHSDGLTTHWRLEQYPGLINRDPRLVAGVLYRDFNRGRDDVTVVVVRELEPSA